MDSKEMILADAIQACINAELENRRLRRVIFAQLIINAVICILALIIIGGVYG